MCRNKRAEDWQQVPSCGPLARIWQFCREVDRTDKTFACFLLFADDRKLVEVTLQHKAIYNGLESEHWWVLTTISIMYSHCSRVRAVACIKYIGTNISEAKIYLRTESSESSVQDVYLNTTVSMTFKGVSIDTEGVS